VKIFRYLLIMSSLVWQVVHAESTFEQFIQHKSVNTGYFSFYYAPDSGKIYLAVEQFEQPFLFQSSMPHGIGSNDLGLDRGQLGATRMVQFERVGEKVLLRQLNTSYRAESANLLEQQSVTEAFASSVLWGFKVEQQKPNSDTVLIDYTPFLLSDIHQLADSLKHQKQGNYRAEDSRSAVYLPRSKAFANNTELEATVTYVGSDAGDYLRSVTPEPQAISVHLHHSLIKLPDQQYQARVFHPFSGFWSIAYADYASAFDQSLIKRLIPRHRLNKQNPNAKYSEPIKPIIYYLDAGVPEPIRSALIDGASWWNSAFEAIGYRNAFQVKMLPVDADPMDIRYNVIQWVHRATRGWSYGSSVIDPRTGEIIKGHVTLGSLRVRQDYLLALALTSPFTSPQSDTSAMQAMALARIRQLAAHEVGHTLGLAHNFAASVNQRASVMDYPHPYVTITNDAIDLSDAYATGLGRWDSYAIAYGYGDYAPHEAEQLQRLMREAQAQGLLYLSDPDARAVSSANADAHLWDNGADPVVELERVMQVRDFALANFGNTTIPFNTPLAELEQALVPLYNFHRYQVEAVAKLIGGLHYSYSMKPIEATAAVTVVAAERQQQALTALINTLDAKWLTLSPAIINLIPPKAYGYQRDRESFQSQIGLAFDPVSAAQASAQSTISLLLNPERLARLQQQSAVHKDIVSVDVLLTQLIDMTVKKTAELGLSGLIQQRINQTLVEQLTTLYLQSSTVIEVRAELLQQLRQLSGWLGQNSASRYRKNPLFNHYQLLKQQIDYSLNQAKMLSPATDLPLPPGSPIG
jgi:hypothetical protein